MMKKSGKQLIVINGRGGVGKDTLCDFAGKYYRVRNVSSITPIKEIAAVYGWKGEKTPKARKFLADLKEAFTQYNDLPTRYVLEQYQEFLDGEEEVMFAHIREGREIDKLKAQLSGNCITLLVRRPLEGVEAWGNAADDRAEQYSYDYIYNNTKTLLEAEKDFLSFLKKILKERG